MPYATAASRAGLAAFSKMIPGNDRHPNAQYLPDIDATLREWNIPLLVMFSDGDIAFKPEEEQRITSMVSDVRFHLVHNAGHYLQEDAGEEIADRMVTFLRGEAKVTIA